MLSQCRPFVHRYAALAFLAAVLTASVPGGINAVTGTVAAAQDAAAAATLEGTWRVQITLRHCETGAPLGPPFPALATFARGGTVTTSDGGSSPAARGAGHGVWWRLQGREFAAVTEAFLFAPSGTSSGRQRLTQQIELGRDGMMFEATIAARVMDPAGQVLFSGCASSEGRRLE
jgi:hypothetical protein